MTMYNDDDEQRRRTTTTTNNDDDEQRRQQRRTTTTTSTTTTSTTTTSTTKRLGGEVIQQSTLVTANDDVDRKQRFRTKMNVDRKRRHQTTNDETWEGGKYKNTTISIGPLVVSWTLSAVQSFDVELKLRHQTTTTPSETREGGPI